MSAKQIRNIEPLGDTYHLSARESALNLSAEKVVVHKNGIEFRSPSPLAEWSEMTVTLQSALRPEKLSCHGIVVASVGNRHTGYNISMLFTGMTAQDEKQLGALARSELGVG